MGNPTYTPLVETWHDGGFIVSESNGHRSRKAITLTGGAIVQAGTVLGQITTGATASAAALGTNTGNGAFGSVTLVTVPTQIGVYSVLFTAATAFTVTAPNGATATGSTGVSFNALGVVFTITAGGTAFVAGDSFTVTTTQKVGAPGITSAAGTNTGNGTLGSLSANGYAPIVGAYKITMIEPGTNVGTFEVQDPNQQIIGHGAVASAFSGGGISFTIADGATDFVSGDQFVVTVTAGSGKWKSWDPGNADGSQYASGILFGRKNATSADKPALAIVRDAEVNASELIYPTGCSASQIASALVQLEAFSIVAR